MTVRALFAAVSAVCLIVWLPLVLPWVKGKLRGRSADAHRSDATRGEQLVSAIVILTWCFAVVPSLLGILEVGRRENALSGSVATTPLQSRLALALSAIIALLCIWLIYENRARPTSRPIGVLVAALAPWAAIEVAASVNAGYITGRQVLIYPLVAIAFWLQQPSVDTLRYLGILTAGTALLSLGLGSVGGVGLVDSGIGGSAKAFLGSGPQLLAGPYDTPNSLALSLALGMPWIFLLRSYAARLVLGGVVIVAILWAAGRTSLVAVAVAAATLFVARATRPPFARLISGIVLAAGVAIAVVTPFVDHAPSAFSRRGIIWSLGIENWQHHVWLGRGPAFFERDSTNVYLFAFRVVHGHNLAVDTLVRGGLLGAAAVVVWLGALAQGCLRQMPRTRLPMAFGLIVVWTSWLEVPLNFSNLGFLGCVVWVPFFVIVFSGAPAESRAVSPVAAKKAGAQQSWSQRPGRAAAS